MRRYLLRLYPRAWRHRYGDEFIAALPERRLGVRDAIDIAAGAADAWLSADVRRATLGARTAMTGGVSMTTKLLCARTETRTTMRDGLIGAAVMLAVSALFAISGMLLKGVGLSTVARMLMDVSSPVALVVWTPFWVMKGTPRKAQAAIVGGTLVVLMVLTWINARS